MLVFSHLSKIDSIIADLKQCFAAGPPVITDTEILQANHLFHKIHRGIHTIKNRHFWHHNQQFFISPQPQQSPHMTIFFKNRQPIFLHPSSGKPDIRLGAERSGVQSISGVLVEKRRHRKAMLGSGCRGRMGCSCWVGGRVKRLEAWLWTERDSMAGFWDEGWSDDLKGVSGCGWERNFGRK